MPKHAILQTHAQILIDVCKNPHPTYKVELIANALPEDAKFVSGGHDWLGRLYLVVESESFKDLKEGDEIPILPDPMFNRIS